MTAVQLVDADLLARLEDEFPSPMAAGADWVSDRAHCRVIPQHISDLFAQCVRNAYETGDLPTENVTAALSLAYGITPTSVHTTLLDLAQQRRREQVLP